MALVVFLRGVNVGGHKTFRPKQLVEQLKHLDAVNIGAAGTFVIRKAVNQTKLREEVARRLPFEVDMAICDGRDILDLVERAPHGPHPSKPDVVRFVSVRCKPSAVPVKTPLRWPASGEWLVRVISVEKQFIVGEYRRHMHTVRHLGQLDKVVSDPVTTRNWNTIAAIAKVLTGSK